MVDFLRISYRTVKNGTVEIYPKFVICRSTDLMIRGGDFYAIWLEEKGLWSTDEQDVLRLIDQELDIFKDEHRDKFDCNVRVLYMWDSETGMIDKWHRYCQKQMRDSFHMLDEQLIFSNIVTKKEDYASKTLSYPLEAGNITAYDRLMSTLYSPEERRKIEWAIGAIVCGDSKDIQKFMVLYGSVGTGKSTVIKIMEQLFEGYCSVFDAKALGSASNVFALESFKSNPLVAIQHDGDLSRIEDNTRLNSLVSHETMTVNEKFKSAYSNKFKSFLIIGTNKPVKITDAKSGLIRRLIDVTPSGDKLSKTEYNQVVKQVRFELGAIAYHCREVYLSDPGYYDNYIPVRMLSASNDFYNFISDAYFKLKEADSITLKAAWEMYKTYCDDAKVPHPFSQRVFKEELQNYFREFRDRDQLPDGTRVRSNYVGFLSEKFMAPDREVEEPAPYQIEFGGYPSIFDIECVDYPAQYATENEKPMKAWDKVTTKLSDLDTCALHYVKVPENHIVIDFDIPDENGEKSFERNLEAASKWPVTYAELSKSGKGIHLHYIYTGDVSKLSRVYADHIEIKVFTGKSSLRRKLTKCNNKPIAMISSGLPLKGDKKMVNFDSIKSEKGLRTQIKRNLNKEIHPATKPSVDFIYKILEDAYESGLHYDVTDMRGAILAFAANSSHQADYCIKLVNRMKFKSEEASEPKEATEDKLVFYDIEVFPNLFLVNWKIEGLDKPVVRMINPKPAEIENLMKFRLVGFNCRRYDNHILYAGLMGYTNEQLYKLSQRIISGNRDAFFGEAYNVSYTDVYDFASSVNKKSLKKLEIEMGNISEDDLRKKGFSETEIQLVKAGRHHQELGLPWDQPVPEELWEKVAEYCDNDVIATEAAFHYLKADWTARQILADLAGMTVNDTTNSLTTRIIFGGNKHPQDQFHYRNLAEPVYDLDDETLDFLNEACPDMMAELHGEDESLLPYFPGYKFEYGISTYMEFNENNPNPLYRKVGEGGSVYSEPGMYGNVALLDIASQHPHSAIAECLFGVKYTRIFRDIVEGRVDIKHEDWDAVNKMMDGKLTPYIQKVIDGEMSSKDLANALKTAINSVYGLTSAKFDNAFRDKRNVDNIVAKRGALFMITLKHEVEKQGFIVAHIKTDSIKIPDATKEIIDFVMDFGKRYGYTFEHEATYDRMCLVNKSTYIARYATPEKCMELYGYAPGDNKKHGWEWTATADQFSVPYVFKTLFTKESIEFKDMCEVKSVQTALYLDMNEDLPDVSGLEKELAKTEDKYKKGKLSDTMFEEICSQLNTEIPFGHNYRFVGKVGQFTPMKPGSGGGLLMRQTDKGYSAAEGTLGYRWMESEMVRSLGKEVDADRTYYDNLVTQAAKDISVYGDLEWFVSDDPYIGPEFELGEYMNHPVYEEELPFD